MKLSRLFSSNLLIIALFITSVTYSFIYLCTNLLTETGHFNPKITEFFYVLAVSTIAACIFYLLQVLIPEKRRVAILKSNFKLNYINFKEDCIGIFFSVIETTHDPKQVSALVDLDEFHSFFESKFIPGQTKWDGVINGLDEKLLKDLFVHFEILSSETDFFLNNVHLHDQEVFYFFKRLKIHTHLLAKTSLDDEDRKSLFTFMWEIFTGRSFVSEYSGYDIFDKMIKKA